MSHLNDIDFTVLHITGRLHTIVIHQFVTYIKLFTVFHFTGRFHNVYPLICPLIENLNHSLKLQENYTPEIGSKIFTGYTTIFLPCANY